MDNFLYRYSSLSKIVYTKIYTSIFSHIEGRFLFLCGLRHPNIIFFPFYYFFVCILGINIKGSFSLINSKSDLLAISLVYRNYKLLNILVQWVLLYFPIINLMSCNLKTCNTPQLNKACCIVRLESLAFPLIYELDIFLDAGLDVLDEQYLKVSADSLTYFHCGVADQKLYGSFFFRYLRLPVLI